METKLKDVENVGPVRIRRFKQNIPKRLERVKSGRQLLALAVGSDGVYRNYDDGLDDSEVEFVGGFFQDLCDYVDMASGFEPIEEIRAAKRIDDDLQELADLGFLAFAAIEVQRLEGGVNSPSDWRMLHLSVCRATGPGIIWQEQQKE